MKMIKRCLASLLALVMCLSLLPTSVFAATDYDLTDSTNGFGLTATLYINDDPIVPGQILNTGDTFRLVLEWRLPDNGDYATDDTFYYDVGVPGFNLSAGSGDLHADPTDDTSPVYGTYTIGGAHDLVITHNDAFLNGLSNRSVGFELEGELNVSELPGGDGNSYTISIPGMQEVVVRVRDDSGLSVSKSVTETGEDENGRLYADYKITITSHAENRDVDIIDYFNYYDCLVNVDTLRINEKPRATLNGEPFDYEMVRRSSMSPQDWTAITRYPRGLTRNSSTNSYTWLISTIIPALHAGDVLEFTYRMTYYAERTDMQWNGYPVGTLNNYCRVFSDVCSTVRDDADEVLMQPCWVAKRGERDGDDTTWIIEVHPGDHSRVRVQDVLDAHQTIADDAVVSIYRADTIHAAPDPANLITTTDWAALRAGTVELTWAEGDSSYRLLVFRTSGDGHARYDNTAKIVWPFTKSYSASVRAEGLEATTGTKTLKSFVYSEPSIGDPDHFVARVTWELDLHIGSEAVALGEDFYFYDVTWCNNHAMNAGDHPFEGVVSIEVKDASGDYVPVTDGRITWAMETLRVSESGENGNGSINKSVPVFRFADGNVIPGDYRITVTSTYDLRGTPGSQEAISNFLFWKRASGQDGKSRVTFWPSFGRASKSATSVEGDEIVWKISVNRWYSAAFGTGGRNFFGDYEYYLRSSGTTVRDTLPADLDYVSAEWVYTNSDSTTTTEPIAPTETINNADGTKTLVFPGPVSSTANLYVRTRYNGDYSALTAAKEFTNKVQVRLSQPGTDEYADITRMATTAKASIQPRKLVDKTGFYDKSTADGHIPSYNLKYTIKLNEHAQDILPTDATSQTYSIEDTLGSALEFMPETLLVNGQPLSAYPNLTLTAAADGHSFTIEGFADETAYIITYDAYILLAPGELLTAENAKNELTIPEVPAGTGGSTETHTEATVVKRTPTIGGDTFSFRIHKVDEAGQPVQNAVFTIYDFGNGYTPTADGTVVGTLTTNLIGNTPSNDKLLWGRIYGIKETTVPEGYSDPHDGGVWIYFAHTSDSYDPSLYPANVQVVTGDATFTYTAVNTTVPSTTELSGSKTWNDANNQDGIRPSSITINLLADGVQVDSKTVTAADNWAWTFTDLPLTNAAGAEIVYTIAEAPVTGYTAAVNGYNVTNTHVPETTAVKGAKTWDDANDQDGLRPTSIIIRLFADGTEIDHKTVTAADNWAWSWAGLPKYKDGTQIVYTITEDAVTGYTPTVNGFDVINTHTPETTSVTIRKVWDDANNQDGKRPATMTVKLLANGTEVRSVTLKASEGWTATITGLPKNANGTPITYTWDEVKPEGYTLTDISVNGAVTTLTNSYTPDVVAITGRKTWNDNNNQDGLRPASITIRLYADGTEIDHKTVTAADNWAWSWTGLPKYKDGTEIVYTITEDAVTGYTTSVNGFNVTNAHTPATINISGAKTWDDNNNQDGMRPTSITVRLYADGTEIDHKTVTAAENWAWSWTGLPEYRNGVRIVYTIDEDSVPEYSKTIDGYNITNKHTTELVKLPVRKIWVDNNNALGARPASITVELLVNGQPTGTTATLNAGNNWYAEFDNLDKFTGGQENAYSVRETSVPANYENTSNVRGVDCYEITNTLQTVKLPVEKVWNDANNQDGIRPASVEVELLANGEATGTKLTLNAGNSWKGEFTDLLKYKEDGTEITYSVRENNVPAGYTAAVTVGTAGYVVTNTHTPEVTSATVKKVWDDANNQDGKRPASLTVTLSNGTTVTLNAANSWQATVNDLPKYENGVEIVYTWTEGTMPEGYTLSGTAKDGTITTLTNSYAPGVTSVSGTKTWDDASNQDGVRPASITIRLYADGTEIDHKVVTAADGWAWSWTGLDEYKDGQKIVYTITEDAVTGYTTTVDGFNVTNKHVPAVTSATVKKVWDDANDHDGFRPASLTVTLSNGTTVTLNAANGWQATVNNLPKYENGVEIVYTWTEGTMPEGYTLSGTAKDGTITTLTNSYTPGVTSVSGRKTWNDNNNQDGIRPASITIRLYADGTEIDHKTVTAADGWAWSWTGLDKYKNGREIVYTISEDAVNGYNTNVDGFNVTNTHEPAKTKISVKKIWKDNQNNHGVRPASIRVTLMCDGADLMTVELNEQNGWAYTFNGLDVFSEGRNLRYTVKENVSAVGYTVSYSGSAEVGYEITNTLETVEVPVQKLWSNDNPRRRPESVEIALLADGQATGQTVVLNEQNEWKSVFTDLLKYNADGTQILYTVVETQVPNGYRVSYSGNMKDGYVVTNRKLDDPTPPVPPIPTTVSVPVSKVWADDNAAAGDRPASVTVVLMRNGVETTMTATLSEANGWSYTFANLPAADASGNAYTYTVKENVPEGYTVSYSGSAANGFVITNTKNGTDIPDDPTPLDPEQPTPVTPVPKTGDESRIAMWLAFGLISLGGITVLGKKRKEDEEAA